MNAASLPYAEDGADCLHVIVSHSDSFSYAFSCVEESLTYRTRIAVQCTYKMEEILSTDEFLLTA